MAHLRERFAASLVRKQSKLWPVVGILGPRQSGKSTLAQSLFPERRVVSLDELENRDEASRSPGTFLAKWERPVVLDEVQKAPELFDAIKVNVDRKRIPGQYLLTGSSSFSAKLGIRESLTGRIGLTELFPLSVAELHRLPFRPEQKSVRVDSSQFLRSALTGGMPVPAFLRDPDARDLYWRSWLDTTLLRDLARFFKRGYDGDFAYSLLNRMGALLVEGELPSLRHFSAPARKVRLYLAAMQEIFLVRRVLCHSEGMGKECWVLMDSGLAAHLMRRTSGEGATLSLVRHTLWNEWACQEEYVGRRMERVYFKSARGAPVDAIRDGLPYLVVPSVIAVTRRLKWSERPLQGAMDKLGVKFGYLIAPVEHAVAPPKKGGIGILPWGAWS